MDVLKVVALIGLQVVEAAENAQFNKAACQELAERVHYTQNSLEQLMVQAEDASENAGSAASENVEVENKKGGSEDEEIASHSSKLKKQIIRFPSEKVQKMHAHVGTLQSLLESILQFIKETNQMSKPMRFIRGGTIRQQFLNFERRLSQCQTDLLIPFENTRKKDLQKLLDENQETREAVLDVLEQMQEMQKVTMEEVTKLREVVSHCSSPLSMGTSLYSSSPCTEDRNSAASVSTQEICNSKKSAAAGQKEKDCGDVADAPVKMQAAKCSTLNVTKASSTNITPTVNVEDDGGEEQEKQKKEQQRRKTEFWEIAYGDIDFEITKKGIRKVLGSGSLGDVCSGYYLAKPVAIKVLRSDVAMCVESFRQEVELLATIRHPNIISVYGATLPHCAEEDAEYTMVMERGMTALTREVLQWQSAEQKIETPPVRSLSVEQRFHITKGIVSALVYLHHSVPQIIHGDIKPTNIMLMAPTSAEKTETLSYKQEGGALFTAKLIDFGLAITKKYVTRLRDEQNHIDEEKVSVMQQSGGYSPIYAAPEVLLQSDGGQLDERSDVFSLGVTLYEIWTGRPADALSNRSEITFPLDSRCPLVVQVLIAACCRRDYKARPYASHVLVYLDQLSHKNLLSTAEQSSAKHQSTEDEDPIQSSILDLNHLQELQKASQQKRKKDDPKRILCLEDGNDNESDEGTSCEEEVEIEETEQVTELPWNPLEQKNAGKQPTVNTVTHVVKKKIQVKKEKVKEKKKEEREIQGRQVDDNDDDPFADSTNEGENCTGGVGSHTYFHPATSTTEESTQNPTHRERELNYGENCKNFVDFDPFEEDCRPDPFAD